MRGIYIYVLYSFVRFDDIEFPETIDQTALLKRKKSDYHYSDDIEDESLDSGLVIPEGAALKLRDFTMLNVDVKVDDFDDFDDMMDDMKDIEDTFQSKKLVLNVEIRPDDLDGLMDDDEEDEVTFKDILNTCGALPLFDEKADDSSVMNEVMIFTLPTVENFISTTPPITISQPEDKNITSQAPPNLSTVHPDQKEPDPKQKSPKQSNQQKQPTQSPTKLQKRTIPNYTKPTTSSKAQSTQPSSLLQKVSSQVLGKKLFSKPKRQENYGDGTELESIDDLVVHKGSEARFMKSTVSSTLRKVGDGGGNRRYGNLGRSSFGVGGLRSGKGIFLSVCSNELVDDSRGGVFTSPSTLRGSPSPSPRHKKVCTHAVFL